MDIRKAAIWMVVGVLVFFGIGSICFSAFTEAWQRNCDKLGATVVDGVAYKCARLPSAPNPEPPK